LPAAKELPPLPEQSRRPASRTMAKRSGRAPEARKEATSSPTSSDGRNPVDQLFSPGPRPSSRKLAWILPSPRSGWSVKETQSEAAATHAEDTVTVAKRSARRKARQRFIVGLLRCVEAKSARSPGPAFENSAGMLGD